VLPEVASLLPEDELDPLFEVEEPELDEVELLDEVVDELVVLELVESVELELLVLLVVLLAVGVDEAVARVSVELPESELEVFADFVEEDLLLELVCVALGTVAATASDPAIPLAATIAVIVAVRALPCRTERAAPSASMDVSVKGCY